MAGAESTEAEKPREWLNDREIAALFYDLIRPQTEEQTRVLNLMLKEAQKSNIALFMLTGDGTFKGQLPMILDNQAIMQRRQRVQGRRLKKVEAQRELDHAQNNAAREKDMRWIRKELRAVRRNQLWIVRRSRGLYEWCTTKDDTGKYSRARLAALYGSLIGAEETVRHVLPVVWHKILAMAHAIRM